MHLAVENLQNDKWICNNFANWKNSTAVYRSSGFQSLAEETFFQRAGKFVSKTEKKVLLHQSDGIPATRAYPQITAKFSSVGIRKAKSAFHQPSIIWWPKNGWH